jgi:hypothetical protein
MHSLGVCGTLSAIAGASARTASTPSIALHAPPLLVQLPERARLLDRVQEPGWLLPHLHGGQRFFPGERLHSFGVRHAAPCRPCQRPVGPVCGPPATAMHTSATLAQ